MPHCPNGHSSAAEDYCDVCGELMAGAASTASGPAEPPPEPCPVDGTPRSGRFCETCGYDFETGNRGGGPPPQPARPAVSGGWSAVVSVDREYFATVVAEMGPDAAALTFPPYAPDRRYLLVGPQVRIGRRSLSRGFVPEIDLSIPPADPGVSHIHAVLLARPDGGWALVDPGSTNGTTINGSTEPIACNVEVPLKNGDRIHVGAWTTITLRKE